MRKYLRAEQCPRMSLSHLSQAIQRAQQVAHSELARCTAKIY